jgi:hypothetical protein
MTHFGMAGAVRTAEDVCSRLAHAEDRERLAIAYLAVRDPDNRTHMCRTSWGTRLCPCEAAMTDEAATRVDPSLLRTIGTTA